MITKRPHMSLQALPLSELPRMKALLAGAPGTRATPRTSVPSRGAKPSTPATRSKR